MYYVYYTIASGCIIRLLGARAFNDYYSYRLNVVKQKGVKETAMVRLRGRPVDPFGFCICRGRAQRAYK